MSESMRMLVVLTLIAVISGGSLAVVDIFTRPQTAENRLAALNEGLRRLMPEAETFEKREVTTNGGTVTAYRGEKDGVLVGWGFLLSGSGFQDKITIVAASDPGITRLLGFEVLEQKETPGLGDNMTKEAFRAQFKGLSLEREIGYVKNAEPAAESNDIQAISAATISTEKLLMIINGNIKKIRASDILESRGESQP